MTRTEFDSIPDFLPLPSLSLRSSPFPPLSIVHATTQNIKQSFVFFQNWLRIKKKHTRVLSPCPKLYMYTMSAHQKSSSKYPGRHSSITRPAEKGSVKIAIFSSTRTLWCVLKPTYLYKNGWRKGIAYLRWIFFVARASWDLRLRMSDRGSAAAAT